MKQPAGSRFGFPASRFAQFVIFASIISAIGWVCLQTDAVASVRQKWLPGSSLQNPSPSSERHPIDDLIEQSRLELQGLLDKRTNNIQRGAEEYRKRRGRHPPPGFGAWYEFAQKHDAIIVEDFFDPIYDDLKPFWGINATTIRRQAKTFPHIISVRNGNTTWTSDWDRPWMLLWSDLISTISEGLPDLDIAINVMDESRIVVPWEEINRTVGIERAARRVVPLEEVITDVSGLEEIDANPGEPFDYHWSGSPYWDQVRVGCHPDSPSRNAPLLHDFSAPPPLATTHYPANSYHGYVKNWTASKDVCNLPHLRELHGTFVEPISIRTTAALFPLFGGSKLPMNNEILLPPAMYWTKDEFYSGGEDHGAPWEEKKDMVVWRGSASGGRNKKENWARFQRHRFVSMINGTSVRSAEESSDVGPPNFDIPSTTLYPGLASKEGFLGDWVESFSDAAFTHLVCFPDEGSGSKCSYDDQYFQTKESMHMQEQYKYKYLPDLDGNSFSGRYRGFLRSTSLPIKATVYNEWHDSRLIAWQHFVPMDNTFIDIYGIMNYFLGDGHYASNPSTDPTWKRFDKRSKKNPSHDAAARKIAEAGSDWAEKVLRREDMQIYVYRLLLEYARVSDENREYIGWVDDITGPVDDENIV